MPKAAPPSHRQGYLPEVTFFLLVAVFAFAYFSANGMYRYIVPLSLEYLANGWYALRNPPFETDSFKLDLSAPYDLPSDYGGGPRGRDAHGPYVAVTSPVLRVTLPRMRDRGEYHLGLFLSARLPRPGQLTIRIGPNLQREFAVRGDGTVEGLGWRLPAPALAGRNRPLRVIPSWPPAGELSAQEGRMGVWFYLRGLNVQPTRAPATSRPGKTP